jgi:peptidoglycan-associated lipoprotein
MATSTAPAGTNQAPASSATPVAPAGTAVPMHLDPNSVLSREHSVYFRFDDAVVRDDAIPVVERHGQYLSHNPTLKVVVQGNTDERGSSEYNLALGQRRAEAVKKSMEIYGARNMQIEAVSFGKEKPRATGHDEAAWQQNRRADIVYVKGS